MIAIAEPPDRLLDLIYDSATEMDLWTPILVRIADLTGSQGGVLFGLSITAGEVQFTHNGRLRDDLNRVYQARHIQNLWTAAMVSQPAGRSCSRTRSPTFR